MNFVINPPENNKKVLRVTLSQTTVDHMKKYCESAGIKKKDYFIEECIKYVLKNDPHWHKIIEKNRQAQ